jgi:hypothetical protein
VKANSRKRKSRKRKMRRLDMKKSEDVGQVESNALAKGQPFVCLKNYFLANVQRLNKRPDERPIYAGQDGQSAGVTVYMTIKRNDLVVKSEI